MRFLSLRVRYSHLLILIVLLFTLLSQKNAFSKEIYRWIDKDGNVFYSNTEAGVPEEYNNEDNSLKFQNNINVMGEDYENNSGTYQDDTPNEGLTGNGIYRIKFNAFEGGARRIIVPVTFNNSVTAQLALDTGSPGLVISSKLAKKLGLYENDSGMLMSFAKGVGGQVTVMRTIIDEIQLGGATESFVPAIITNSMSDSFEGLIGMDFMSKYSISIDNVNHYLVLKANSDSSNYPAGHSPSWWKNTFREFNAYRDEWQRISGIIEDWENSSLVNINMAGNDVKKLKDLAQWQYQESTKLLNRLESYARQHEVPQQWRR